MKNETINKLSTGLTCKIDKNGRVHVYKTKQEPAKVKTSETLIFASIFLALTTVLFLLTK